MPFINPPEGQRLACWVNREKTKSDGPKSTLLGMGSQEGVCLPKIALFCGQNWWFPFETFMPPSRHKGEFSGEIVHPGGKWQKLDFTKKCLSLSLPILTGWAKWRDSAQIHLSRLFKGGRPTGILSHSRPSSLSHTLSTKSPVLRISRRKEEVRGMAWAVGSNSRCQKVDRKGPGGRSKAKTRRLGPSPPHSIRDSQGNFFDFRKREGLPKNFIRPIARDWPGC